MILKKILVTQCLQQTVLNINYIKLYLLINISGFSAWRPDKFLLKNHDNLKPKSIKIIGKEPIPEKKMEKLENDQISIKNKVIIKKIATYVLTPSDHYGLEIDIEFC